METAKLKRVIINADDYGWSPGITEGILQAHRRGILTSTTIAANLPHAAEAAKRLAGAPALGVGVHLNVSQGPPLSDLGRRLAGEDGVMNRTAMGVIRVLTLRPWLLKAVEAEFDAQIRWVLDHGIRPDHLDSHRHAHGWPPVFRRVVRLAGRYDIPFVRWPAERLGAGDWPAAPAKQRRNRRVLNALCLLNASAGAGVRGTSGTWGIAHTGRINEEWLLRAARLLPPGVTEIMTHPGLPGDLDPGQTRLVECRRAELEALCSPAVRKAFEDNEIELITYGHLHKPQSSAANN